MLVKVFVAALALLLAASPLQADDKPLVFSTIVGSFNGMLGEAVLKEVYGRLGLTFTTEPLAAPRALLRAKDGITEGEVQRIRRIGELHPSLLRVDVPLFRLEAVVFTKDLEIDIDGVESLAPYSVGIVRGVVYAEEMSKKLERVTRLTGHDELFLMLDRGRLDAVILNRYSGLHSLKRTNTTGIRILEPPLLTQDLYHYLHEKHAALVPRLEAVLRDMQQDGSLARIIDDSLNEIPAGLQ